MAEKEEVGSVVIDITADTTDLDRQLASLAARIAVTGQQINRAMNTPIGGLFKGPIEEITPALDKASAAMKNLGNDAAHVIVEMGKLRSAGKGAAADVGGAVLAADEVSRKLEKNVGFMTSNLVAQFQDVAVQATAGTNVLQIALQQGTQMALVFDQAAAAGVGFVGKLKLVKDAFLGLFTPMTFIPIAVTAAIAAIIQFASATDDSMETAKKAIQEFEDQIKEIGKAFGIITSDLDKFVDKSKELLKLKLSADITKSFNDAQEAARNLNKELGQSRFGFALAPRFRNLGPLSALVKELHEQIRTGSVDWEEYKEKIEEVAKQSPGLKEKAVELLALIETVQDAEARYEALKEAEKRLAAAEGFKKLTGDADKYSDVLKEIEKLNPIEETTIEKFERLRKELTLSATSAREYVDGIHLLEDALDKVAEGEQKAFDADQIKGFSDAFSKLIQDVEGFSSTPYNDPSAAQKRRGETDLAIGFGMHQLIDDAGKAQDIIDGMVVTQKEAVEQLAMQWDRIYYPAVLRSLGKETWDKLDDNMKAAIASITWNFGHVPESIKKAAETLDRETLSKAILALPGPEVRRAKEAATALGKTYVGVIQDEAEANRKAKEATDAYILSVENKAKVDQLEASLVNASAYQRAYQVTILKEHLKAQEQELQQTPELEAAILRLAEAAGTEAQAKADATAASKAKAEADRELEKQNRILQRTFDRVSSTLEDAFVDAILNGEKLEDVVRNLTKALLEMALRASLAKLFGVIGGSIGIPGAPALGGGGGFLGSVTAAAAQLAPTAGPVIAARSAGAVQPPVVQLQVAPGQMFEPTVTRISGNVAVRTVQAATPALSAAAAAYMGEKQKAYG